MLQKTRKQRWVECHKVLAEHMEEFVRVGLALREIRDDQLYKEGGYDTFEKCVKEEWDIGKSYATQLIGSATLRLHLPTPKKVTSSNQVQAEWNASSVRELKRLESTSKANHVARVVLKAVDNGDAKLTARTIRKHVDAELGIDRKNPKPKPKPKLEAVILRWTDEIDTMASQIQSVPADALKLYGRNNPAAAKKLAAAIERLEKSLTRVWESLP